MAYSADAFNTSAVITGYTLIRDTDEQLNKLLVDVANYLTNQNNKMYTDINQQAQILLQSILAIAPDSTYYTKTAIDGMFSEFSVFKNSQFVNLI